MTNARTEHLKHSHIIPFFLGESLRKGTDAQAGGLAGSRGHQWATSQEVARWRACQNDAKEVAIVPLLLLS